MYMHLCVCIYSTKQVYYYTKCVCVYLRILPLLRKKNIKTQAQKFETPPPSKSHANTRARSRGQAGKLDHFLERERLCVCVCV